LPEKTKYNNMGDQKKPEIEEESEKIRMRFIIACIILLLMVIIIGIIIRTAPIYK
jgi:hypothetical protein